MKGLARISHGGRTAELVQKKKLGGKTFPTLPRVIDQTGNKPIYRFSHPPPLPRRKNNNLGCSLNFLKRFLHAWGFSIVLCLSDDDACSAHKYIRQFST